MKTKTSTKTPLASAPTPAMCAPTPTLTLFIVRRPSDIDNDDDIGPEVINGFIYRVLFSAADVIALLTHDGNTKIDAGEEETEITKLELPIASLPFDLRLQEPPKVEPRTVTLVKRGRVRR